MREDSIVAVKNICMLHRNEAQIALQPDFFQKSKHLIAFREKQDSLCHLVSQWALGVAAQRNSDCLVIMILLMCLSMEHRIHCSTLFRNGPLG